jgi:multidrug/hemolysin transport system permease protein
MTNALLLARRNIQLYLRDKTGVFLSFLSVIILVVLYALFIFQLNLNGITDALTQQGITPVEHDVSYFINVWVFAGIVMVATVTTGLGGLVSYVDDRVSGRFTEFIVMPVQRWQIVAGYYLSSLAVAFAMGSFALWGGWGVIRIMEGQAPSLIQILQAWGWAFVCAAGFAAFNAMMVTFCSTVGSFVTLSTIMGGMIGFLAAAYIPEHMMPKDVVSFINSLPFAQAAALPRRALATDAMEQAAQHSDVFIKGLRESYGFDLLVGSTQLPGWLSWVTLLALIAICGTIATIQLHRRIGR